MKPREGRYLVTVDHLRALAALLIVFYHGAQLFGFYLRTGTEGFSSAPWPRADDLLTALVTEGHASVALFMVLSGFIFTNGSWDQDIAYGTFLANRLWRIYPLFVFLTMYSFLLYPAGFSLLGAAHTLLPIGGLPGAIENDVSAVSWAVRVEFQFYLVFPFLHRFTRRLGVRYLGGMLALMLLLRGWAFAHTGRAQDLAYWTILGRMDEFVIGMLVAHAHHRLAGRDGLRRLLFVPAVALFLGWLWWFNRSGGWPFNGPSRILWPLLEGTACGLVILTYLSFEELPRFRASLPARALARVGEISFSLYLWHYLVIKTLVHRGWIVPIVAGQRGNALLNTLLVALPCALAIAFLSFNMIERPFFQFRKSYLRT